ncbi:hypothetical protein QJU43_04265 [Pasteurella atlantica]|uniref:Uncharacterized protein n=2 Tax=Pasteurellaceae TaxID=712 RepID=A0ACC6HL35_9PAST|nr:hypothetical protein [Pasteurella atlantica]MDP8033661.1 hypothetical protein [Pasteurella atlantica]MDP8035559.1 hypothetical protein [Pasteurella atlantica]MDP8037510.1 hypothetical protein [Pasteurella atlantica]MDP8047859.1 hypothetical protein [Pasteurella atlantica]MDP8049814.1 hypothetical protein [Pasteurella atlantica]
MSMINKFDKTIFEKAQQIVNKWDFSLAIDKLCEREDWNKERAEKAVADYRIYMAATKALNGEQMVPNGDIDEIWHMHILDTRAYLKDCLELFGGFLHHYPYFGRLSDENRQEWLDAQNESQQLWADLTGKMLYSATLTAPNCPQACPCNIDEDEPLLAIDNQYIKNFASSIMQKVA